MIYENIEYLSFDSSLKNIQSTQSDVSRSRERIASGKALTRASDDTSKLRNIETLQSSLKRSTL